MIKMYKLQRAKLKNKAYIMNKLILSLFLLFYTYPCIASKNVIREYNEIMSKQTDTQLLAKRKAEASVTSDIGEIVRATTEDYLVYAFLIPEYTSLSITNIVSSTDTTDFLKDDIKEYLDTNIASRRPGDTKTPIYRCMGNNIRIIESVLYKIFK